MNKTEFLAFLLTKGYNAIMDHGAVMVIVDEPNISQVYEDVHKLVRKCEYMASWGVRLERKESGT